MQTGQLIGHGLSNPFKAPLCVDLECKLDDALALMKEHEIHHLLVFDHNELAGLISDRCIYEHLMAIRPGKGDICVKDIDLHRNQRVKEETEVGSALAILREAPVKALAVEREKGQWHIVTEGDFLAHLQDFLGQPDLSDTIVSPAKASMSNPLVQSLMKMLSDLGI